MSFLLGLGAALTLAAAPVAQADPAFEVTAEPDRVAPGEEAVFTVKVTTGAGAERFGLRFAGLSGYQGRPLWPLLDVASAATHEGLGEFRSAAGPSPGAAPSCSRFEFPATRGFVFEGSTWAWLELPAHSVSRVRMAATASSAAPRVGERYGISVTTFNGDAQHSGGTLDSPGPLPAPTLPPADGPRGVWLDGSIEPDGYALGHAPCPPHLSLVREPITFRGRTDPPLPGQMVTIEGGPRSASAPAAIGTAVVGDDGTFTFGPWTPPAAGDYELRAVYRSQQPEFTDDHMEPALGFHYLPAFRGVESIVDWTRVRGRVAAVRIGCPVSCSGVLRLRRGRVLWGRRSFSFPEAGVTVVRVRLNRRAQAALARRAPMTVRAEHVRAGRVRHAEPIELRTRRTNTIYRANRRLFLLARKRMDPRDYACQIMPSNWSNRPEDQYIRLMITTLDRDVRSLAHRLIRRARAQRWARIGVTSPRFSYADFLTIARAIGGRSPRPGVYSDITFPRDGRTCPTHVLSVSSRADAETKAWAYGIRDRFGEDRVRVYELPPDAIIPG